MRSRTSQTKGAIRHLALHYAHRGLRVVALAGKRPITKNGYKDGSCDPRQIGQWFDRQPNANVGILVGPESALCVLDIDPRHGGDVQLARLEVAHGPLPPTWTVETGGGGRHYYFRFDPRAGRRVLAPGVELKARGGYVVAPPSIHPDSAKSYRWNYESRLAALPEWLVELSVEPRAPASAPSSIPPGERNATLTRIAGAMRRLGSGDEEILAALRVANTNRCVTPLSSDEVERIVASVGRYAPEPPAVPTPRRNGAERKHLDFRGNPKVSAPSVPPWRSFPVEAFPPACRRFISESAQARGLDPAFIGAPMLAALAGAIGNSRRLRLKASYVEPAVLWCVTVARSGVGKSSPSDDVLRPHREEERRLAEENQAANEHHWEALTRHEADRADYRRARKRDPKLSAPARPDAPPNRALLVEDITVEALAERLADNPRGVLLAKDELSGWFGGFDAYKNAHGADVAHYLSMHRAGSLTVDRKDRRRPRIFVPRAAVSVVGTIQPRALARAIRSQHRENGLLARLLVTMPRESVPRWTEADVSPAAYASWETVVGTLLKVLGDERDLMLAPAARERYRSYHDECARVASTEDDDLFAALAKLRGGALRLALVLALARAAEQGLASELQEVDLEAMDGGIALADWFAHEARRVYATLREEPEEQDTRRLLEWIEGTMGGRVAPHELARSGPRRFRGSSEEAEVLLRRLAGAGFGVMAEHASGPSGGRPSTVFVLMVRGAETHEIHSEGQGSVSAPERSHAETPACELVQPGDEAVVHGFLSQNRGASVTNERAAALAGAIARSWVPLTSPAAFPSEREGASERGQHELPPEPPPAAEIPAAPDGGVREP